MANPYINIYKNNPTYRQRDGTIVSTDGNLSAPINFLLDAAEEETQIIKLAIRTEDRKYTATNVNISVQNDPNGRLKLSWKEEGPFVDSINTNDFATMEGIILSGEGDMAIGDTNEIFYAKASSASSEVPQTDISASLLVSGIISSQ